MRRYQIEVTVTRRRSSLEWGQPSLGLTPDYRNTIVNIEAKNLAAAKKELRRQFRSDGYTKTEFGIWSELCNQFKIKLADGRQTTETFTISGAIDAQGTLPDHLRGSSKLVEVSA